MVKTLIIADAHIGQKGVDSKHFKKILNSNISISNIIILGDFIDLWRRKPHEVIIENGGAFELLETYNTTYVKGNHDFVIDEFIDIDVDFCDKHKYAGYIFEHGHRLDYLTSNRSYIEIDDYYKFAKRMCYSDTETASIVSTIYEVFDNLKGLNKIMGHQTNDYKTKLTLIDCLLDVSRHEKTIIGHFHYDYNSNKILSINALCDGYYTLYDNYKGKFEQHNTKDL